MPSGTSQKSSVIAEAVVYRPTARADAAAATTTTSSRAMARVKRLPKLAGNPNASAPR